MAKARLGRVYGNWALIVDEQELRRICDEIKGVLQKTEGPPPTVGFEIYLSDRLSFSTSSLDEVIKEENSRRRAIIGLEIRGGSGESNVAVRLGLEHEGKSRLTVEGEDRQWVYVSFSVLEDRLKRLKQWYPRRGWWGFLGIVSAFVLMTQSIRLLGAKYGSVLWEGEKATLSGTGVLVAGALWLAYGTILTTSLVWLFPNLVFRIGDGIRRHDTLVAVRWRLFWLVAGTGGLGALYRLVSTLLG